MARYLQAEGGLEGQRRRRHLVIGGAGRVVLQPMLGHEVHGVRIQRA